MQNSTYLLKAIESGIDYNTYRSITDKLLSENKTSGDNHSTFMVSYTRQNVERMNYLDETAILNESLLQSLKDLSGTYIFLVLTESWCGDASQIVPVLHKIAEASGGKVELKLVWRDENLDLMDQYLTNGGRSIPKLVVLEKETLQEKASWGPRPKVSQELYSQWKGEGLNMLQISDKLHNWYAEDKTEAVQKEIIALLNQL